jgi:UDPglucose 6-dehydrogenase
VAVLKVGVVGVGYVGLSTAVCMAIKFHTVAIDINTERIAELQEGNVSIHEQGLEALLAKGLSSKRLQFSSDSKALADADAIFIAVGTPSGEDGSINLSQVRSSCVELGGVVKNSTKKPLVMMRSTVIPGTARNVVKALLEEGSAKKCGLGFGVCSNPEFLREGTAIRDTLDPNRIILGPLDGFSLRSAEALFRKFYGRKIPSVVVTTPEGAELIKYGSNSFLAAKISFINLLSRVCELFPGTDVTDVSRGLGLDPRIGPLFLRAGPGFGGSCLPKDVRAFARFLKGLGLDPSILEGIVGINEGQPQHIVALAEKSVGPLSEKEVAVLGLAFKANTGDVRESRSIPVIKGLLEKRAKIRVYDPVAMAGAKAYLDSRVDYSTSAIQCITGADLVIVMTEWKQFKSLKPADFVKVMRSPVILDTRRIYDPKTYSRKVRYVAVGRGEDSAA